MTISMDELKTLATGAGLNYFVDPSRPAILMGFKGMFGSYQLVALVELDGRFVQLRTVGYGNCPVGHPHLEAVLRVIGELDYKLRLTKFGWDPADGEIVGYADLWLEDATVTQAQFIALLRAFVPAIDVGHDRLTKTMATGIDPEGTTGGGAGVGAGAGDRPVSEPFTV